jgi:hypothetical protein
VTDYAEDRQVEPTLDGLLQRDELEARKRAE